MLNLVVPLPCTCFNGTDNNLPAIYMSYVVKLVDTLAGIATRYSTTITDLMTVNSMGGPAISDGDILAVPLSGNLIFLVVFVCVWCSLVCLLWLVIALMFIMVSG